MRTSSPKVLFLYILILTFNLPCVIFAQCTGGMALGFPAGDNNLIGATLDWNGPANLSMLKAKLVTDGKYRYLRVAFGGQPGDGAWLNEKGLGYKDFSRLIGSAYLTKIEIDQEMVSDQLMKTSDSAKSFIDTWTPILTQSGCGQPEDSYCGWALLVVDNTEGYLVEAGDVNDNGTVKHPYAVFGPMRNTVFAHSNYYLDETLRSYQMILSGNTVGGVGYERARHLWNMLTQKQYFKISSNIDTAIIDVPFFMDVLRSRGTESVRSKDEQKQMWFQKPLSCAVKSQGIDAICKNVGTSGIENIGLTYCGQIIKPSKTYPQFLSCIWSGLSFPLTSPYLPFYIGINELPAKLQSGDKEGDFAYVFNQLYNLVFCEKNVKGKAVLTPSMSKLKSIIPVWENFDGETYKQSIEIESQVAALAAEGKESEARQLLSDFLDKRMNDAIVIAQDLITKWSK